MHIKRFTGSTVKEAIKAIKAELGEGALILSTKRITSGYEVVAAVDYDLAQPVNLNIADGTYGNGERGPASSGGFGLTGSPGANPGCAMKPVQEARGSQLTPELKRELKELRELKDFFMNVVSGTRTRASEVYSRLEEELVGNGVDRRLARKILVTAFNGAGRERAGDIGYLKSYMRNRISERIAVADPLAQRGVVTFVGPAGVGKTTTIAKLAAIHALKKKRRLALITMDTYRIAAAEQLKVYGKIIGVPVEVARTSGEIGTLIKEHGDKDLVLIDTAGRSRKNSSHIRDLRELSGVCPEMRFNLVLSTQTRDEGLYESIRGFEAIPIDSLTFTRLDEAGVYGPILNTMILSKKPVAYLTAGQRVPEDIETATKERLLSFFMPN